jgi:hypothetical protein
MEIKYRVVVIGILSCMYTATCSFIIYGCLLERMQPHYEAHIERVLSYNIGATFLLCFSCHFREGHGSQPTLLSCTLFQTKQWRNRCSITNIEVMRITWAYPFNCRFICAFQFIDNTYYVWYKRPLIGVLFLAE